MIEPSRELRDSCAIVGAGNSRLGRVPGVSSLDLLVEAMRNAIADAGIDVKDIDGIVCRGPDDIYSHHQRIGARLGINVRFSTSLDNGGASQILAVAIAIDGDQGGARDDGDLRLRPRFLVAHPFLGRGEGDATRPRPTISCRRSSRPNTAYFGAVAAAWTSVPRRHMHLYGTTRDQFGEIAVAFREHALRNPDAQMKKPLTKAQYHEAPQIVAPFGLYDCSLRSDGAGAVIVTSRERARDLKQPPVLIKGFGSFNNLRGWFNDDNMVVTAAKQSGEIAYKMAGLGPDDVDTAQIYDCFTYMVLTQLEDYGFCKKGEGGPFVASGALRMDGRLPTNTSGGQLSEAHVEGMLQVVEGARQMRHTYPAERQVKDAEIALVSGHGGNQVCHSTLILGRA